MSPHSSLAGLRILVIEDDPVMQDILSHRFSPEGVEIRMAENGTKGKEEMSAFKPDIVLLDLLLPGEDGFAVLEAAKANPETKSIPIIVLSNLAQTKEVERGIRLGAAAYLVKTNVTPSQIVEEVKRVLGKS